MYVLLFNLTIYVLQRGSITVSLYCIAALILPEPEPHNSTNRIDQRILSLSKIGRFYAIFVFNRSHCRVFRTHACIALCAGSHVSQTTRFDSYEIKPASQTSSRATKDAAASDHKKENKKSSSEGKSLQSRRTNMSINLLSSLIRNLSRAPADSIDLKSQA